MREHPDLELENEDADNAFAWTLQRAGWAAMLLLVVAAVLGAFGSGPLNRTRVDGNGLELSYSRFQRATRPDELVVTVSGPPGETTRIWIDQTYASSFEISSVMPEPASSTTTRDKAIFEFRRKAGEPLVVTLRLRSNAGTFGRVAGSLGVEGGGQAEFSQFIWP